MPYAITQTCCTDASCIAVCPVNCIHPTPDEPDFGTTEMLYIDPKVCIDCGACAEACPVDAPYPADRLTPQYAFYADLNKQYYEDDAENAENTENTGGGLGQERPWDRPHFRPSLPADADQLRVAVVGTGPAALYTTHELLTATPAKVTLIDRLPVPSGLVRSGVAPDHPSTKKIGESFADLYRHDRLSMRLNVEVGSDITHEELAAHHDAVIYAVGAATDKELDIPGEQLSGSISATTFVAWYNAHPEVPTNAVDLSGERVVIIGTGNVALDAARILLSDPEQLARTEIADHALQALRASRVREVVLLARRGPDQAAYTRPEFLAMKQLPGVQVAVVDSPEVRRAIESATPGSKAALLSDVELVPDEPDIGSAQPERPAGRRLLLRFLSSPVALSGNDRVEGIRIARTTLEDRDGSTKAVPTGEEMDLPAQLVVRSIGYRATRIPDLPFDEDSATVPNEAGRVVDAETGDPVRGTYVVGWIKRGPSGGIGMNKADAAETIDALIEDALAGVLPKPTGSAASFRRLVRTRQPLAVTSRSMQAIDWTERRRGRESGRPRVKLSIVSKLTEVANWRRSLGRSS